MSVSLRSSIMSELNQSARWLSKWPILNILDVFILNRCRFMDYVRQEAMIDNVVMLIQGTINNKNPKVRRIASSLWYGHSGSSCTM